MNLNQLQYFLTLARMEHFTKAADVLGISQPSLSHAMNMLEQEIGTQLFQKKGRNIELTKYGKVFREHVEEALGILDLGIKKTRDLTGQTTGVIDLAYIYTLGNEFVPRIVADFIRNYEELQVRFHFSVGNTSEIIRGLKEEKYDVAFCSIMEKEQDIEFVPVGIEKLVVVVPKGHPLSERGSINLEETASYPQIFFTKTSGLRPVIDNIFKAAHVKPQIAYEIEEDSSMAGLVAHNFGIAVMPDIPILKNMEVDILEINALRHKRYVYMAYSKNNYQIPVVGKFIQYVESMEKNI